MQYPHPLHPPCDGLECEHADCAAPATEVLESEEHGPAYFCAAHAAERALCPVVAGALNTRVRR